MRRETFLVRPGTAVQLARYRTDHTEGIRGRRGASRLLAANVAALAEQQEALYAQDRWSLLIILQAMDAAGKDSTIKHVMSGINPQGVHVTSFKAPSVEELDHDYLWRSVRALPARGMIGIHNRSYYEEVLVARVHPAIVARQRLPAAPTGRRLWRQRFRQINDFERYLTENGTIIIKFFLHVSREEQRQRFLARLDEPDKHWKFSLRDVQERERWDDYREAYEDMLTHTSTARAPWHVIPADRKWYMRLAVGQVIVQTVRALDLRLPQPDEARLRELEEGRRILAGTTGTRGTTGTTGTVGSRRRKRDSKT
jgi:PPK2 family polyphosphate:nucleotide phosphotransferase